MDERAEELGRRIEDLARRVESLERRLDEPVEGAPEPTTPAPTVPEPIEPTEPTGPAEPAELPEPAAPASVPEKRERLERFVHRRETEADIERLESPAADWLVPEKRPREPRKASLNLEQFVGARLFAVVGALVIVIGAALILKVAWDNEWFDVMSDSVKCVVGAGFGFALLGAGEVVRRRISAAASIGPSAAGIGVLYASAYAAYGFFGLVSHETGFVLLVAAAALGVLVGARARLASVSALSIVGAYFVPLFFMDVDPKPAVMPTFLSSILAIGLLLSAMLGGRFTGLRTLVWWGTVVFGSAWSVLMGGAEHPWLSLLFFAFVWGAIHAELIYSAKHRGLTGDEAPTVALTTWRTVRPLASSFSVSAWATLLASVALFAETGDSWPVPAGLCVVTVLLAFLIGDGLRVLREPAITDVHRLAWVLVIEAGALLIAAVALGFAGWMEVVAWLALGIGAVVGGRALKARPLDVYGLVVLTLVTLRLALVDQWMTATAVDDKAWLGMHLTRWSLLIAIAGVSWLIAARVLQGRAVWRSVRLVCIGIGLTVFFAAGFHEQTSALAEVWLLLAIAASVFGAGAVLGSAGLRVYAMSAPGLAASALLVTAWLDPETGRRLGSVSAESPIVLTNWTPAMLAMFACWIGAAVFLVRAHASEQWAAVAQCCAGLGLGFLFLAADHPASADSAVAWAWLALAVAVYSGNRLVPALHARRWGIVGAAVAAGPWLMAYVMEGWSDNTAASGAHPGLWLALAIAGVLIAMSLRVVRLESAAAAGRAFGWAGSTIAAGLIFGATTLEAGRIAELMTDDEMSRRAVISIWWGVFAIGLIALGFWRRVPVVRHTGLALMSLATCKAVVFDLHGVPLVWRAVSFIALGLMMLAVGLVYARVSASVAGESEREG